MSTPTSSSVDAMQARFFPSATAVAASSYSVSPPAVGNNGGLIELQVVWQGHWHKHEKNGDAMKDDAMDLDEDIKPGQDARMSNREYKLSVGSYQELVVGINEFFPTRPDHPIQITTEQQASITSQADFRRLKNQDVVLVFESNSRTIVWNWSKSFQNIPHPSIVTYSQELIAEEGRKASHPVVYALAEFIDNSISGLRKYRSNPRFAHHEGHIRISLLYSNSKNLSVIIDDDGCGMDTNTLQSFSRMADAPQYRGEQREDVSADVDNHYLNINISQWGIGAKSAGFFIGDSIIASTRSLNANQVLELSMSQKKMFAAHKKTGNAYDNKLFNRAAGQVAQFPISSQLHPYMEYRIREEVNQTHFTRMYVTGVETRHRDTLLDIDTIASQLADIYNRFLHGPLGRDSESSKGNLNRIKTWLRPNITIELVDDSMGKDGRPFTIQESIDLREYRDNDTSQYQLLRRGPVFRFEIKVNAPITDTHSTESVKGTSQSSEAVIRGEIYYLPRSVDGETHPGLKHRQEEERLRREAIEQSAVSRNQTPTSASRALISTAAAASSSSRYSKDRVDTEGNLIMDDDSLDTFDLYWHGRLIPLSHVNKLKFMKFTPDNKDCLRRMKGFLFCAFPFLTSRNKLTFAERNLEAYLNSRESKEDFILTLVSDDSTPFPYNTKVAKKVSEKWKETLTAWRALDANYEWNESHFLTEESRRTGLKLYSQVSIHGASNKEFQTLKVGGRYKLQKPNSGKGSKAEWVVAKYFEKESPDAIGDSLDENAGEFGGAGNIHGDQVPREAQLPRLVRSLRWVDKETPQKSQDIEYEKYRSALMASEPHHITVWMVPRVELKDGQIFRKNAGWSFPGTAIAVYGHLHNGMHRALGSSEKAMLKIRRHAPGSSPVNDGAVVVRGKRSAPGASSAASSSKSRPLKRPRSTDDEDRLITASRHAPSKQTKQRTINELSSDASDEEDSDPEDEIEMRDTAPCMTRELADAIANGGTVNIAATASSSSTTAVSATNARKRKNAAGGELGANGFEDYRFPNSKLGRYTFTFSLPNYLQDGLKLNRSSVKPVTCQVILKPSLPVTIQPSRSNAAPIETILGKEDEAGAIGFQLLDAYDNPWNDITLLGDMSACGVRITNIQTQVPNLTVQYAPQLVWNAERKCWTIANLQFGVEGDASLPGLVQATDRIDVDLAIEFDVNPDCSYDPPPKPDMLTKLRSTKVPIRVRLGPGEAHEFTFQQFEDVTVDNMGTIQGSGMHMSDIWHHPTAAYAQDMRITLATTVQYITQNTFYAGDHDVLTRTGWKLIHEVQVGDDVWSLNNPSTGDVRQGWSRVLSVASKPAPEQLWQYYSTSQLLLGMDFFRLDGVEAVAVERDNRQTVYSLTSQAGNFYIRHHDNTRRWQAIFTGQAAGESDSNELPFPLTTLQGRDSYQFDEFGRIAFPPLPLQFTPTTFAAYCAEPTPGAPVVEFNLKVLFGEEAHVLKSVRVTVQPRYGPVQLLLFKNRAHLAYTHEKVTPQMLEHISLDGFANGELPPLYLGLLHESGFLIPIQEFKTTIGLRQKQLHFYLDGLDGAMNHFTLADLNPEGRIDSGLTFPPIIGTGANSSASKHPPSDIVTQTILGTLRMVVDETVPIPQVSDELELKVEDDEDVAMEDSENAPLADKKPKLSTWLPFTTLKTPFTIRLSPGAPVRWAITTSFLRGFKCGIIFGESLQIALVDQYGNRTAIPPERATELQLELQVFSSPPGSQPLIEHVPSALASSANATASSSGPQPMDLDTPSSSTSIATAEVATSASSMSETIAPPSSPSSIATAAVPSTSTPTATSANVDPDITATSLKNFNPTRPQLASGVAASYYCSPQSFLVAPIGLYWLVARDKSNLFAPSIPTEVQLIPGQPHRMRVFTSPECAPSSEVGYASGDPSANSSSARSLAVTAKGRVPRIWCKFYDRGNNETTSSHTAQLQLVLPKEAPPVPSTVANDGTVATSSSTSSSGAAGASAKVEAGDEASQVDTTVSGIYAYPLADTGRGHQSIFTPAGRNSHTPSTPRVKDEFKPLGEIVGALKEANENQPSCVILEEFTIHLNAKHYVGSTLRIQAREIQSLPGVPSMKKKPSKITIKYDVIIPLDVKPFVNQITGINLTTSYEEERMRAALSAKPDELSLKSELLRAPRSIRAPPTSSSRSVTKASDPVAAGTPFPIIQVDMKTSGMSGFVQRIQANAASTAAAVTTTTAATPATPEPVVKLEPGLTPEKQEEDSRIYMSSFMLKGLSIEVKYFPLGVLEVTRMDTVPNIYQQPHYDSATNKFVFEPIHPSALESAAPAASVASQENDYVYNNVGDWLFIVRYNESRETIADILLPDECLQYAEFHQKVIAGQPKRMAIESHVNSEIVVGNLPAVQDPTFRNTASRTIASNLTMKFYDQFGQSVPFSSLSEDSLNAIRAIQWRVSGIAERPLPVPSATTAAPPSTTTVDPTIIIIDSDDDEPMSETTTPATSAAASTPLAPLPAPITPPQLAVSPPTLDMATSSLVFRDISIVPNSVGDSGKYLLRFSLPPPFDLTFTASLNFYFSNDQIAFQQHTENARKRKELIQTIQKRWEAKLAEIVNEQNSLRALEEKNQSYRAREKQLHDQLQRVAQTLERVGLIVPPAAVDIIPNFHNFLLQQQDQLRQQQSAERHNSIPAKIESPRGLPPVPSLSRGDGYHGRVCELAYFTDPKLCALISWHLHGHLPAFVTSDRGCVADREIRNWCRNNHHGMVIDLAGMNKSTFDPSRLPHQFLSQDPSVASYQPKGNPRFLVNCLQFNTNDSRDKRLYYQLFCTLANRVLILDSMEDALEYRAFLVKHSQICPSILVLKECKSLPSNNIERFDTNSYARGLNHLESHFEIKSQANRSQYDLREQEQEINAALENLPRLEPIQRQLQLDQDQLHFTRHSQSFNLRIHEMKQQLAAIEADLRQLGVTPTPPIIRPIAPPTTTSSTAAATSSSSTATTSTASSTAASSALPSLSQQTALHDQARRRAQLAAGMAQQERQREEHLRRQRMNQSQTSHNNFASASFTSSTAPPLHQEQQFRERPRDPRLPQPSSTSTSTSGSSSYTSRGGYGGGQRRT